MELAAAELSFSTLSPIFKKLCKYAYDSNFGGDVTAEEMKHLNDFVRFKIMALIREAELDPSDQLRPLLENLQATAFEAEDLLDLYEYKQIKYQVSSSPNLIKKSISTVKENLGFMLPKSSLRISLEKLLKFADEIQKLYPLIKFRPDMTQQISKIPQANTSTSNPSSPYFGRVKQCDIIIEFLLDESHVDSIKGIKRVPIIAVRGLGGSGKTVTVQHVYNDDRIKKCFDLRMWVHVSRSFDVHRLTKAIIESAIDGECPQMDNLDVLQRKLKESVSKRKNFLLVLDDIWCDDKMQWDQLLMKWDQLLSPLNEVGGKGSKIIITTRMEEVASILQVENVFPLEELKDEDCWSILKHYAFNNHEEIIEDQKLVNVGNQIISKVKYSPLALRIVGSSLSKRRSVNEWEKILKRDMLKETRDVLLFSFQHLPSHLQRCFAYCSLFPKGYLFYFDGNDKNNLLIPLWISQGFIENTSELTLEEEGLGYIEELLSYSFFEKSFRYSFVIHDLLHDLAEEVSKNRCHRIEHSGSLNIPTTCIHLSIFWGERLESTYISDILKLRYLRTLLIFDSGDFNDNIDIFRNLTKLRALYVNYDSIREGLSNLYIDKLKHLRYLHVRYDKKLPSSLTKLYHLQFCHLFTNISDDYVRANTLPQGFGNLINLRTLKLYGSWGHNELDYLYYNTKEISIEKLTSLQNLIAFHPEKDSVNGMIPLKNIPLCGSLKVLNLENVKSKVEAAEAMLNQKRSLNELEFGWSNTSSSTENSNTCKEVLEGLEPHSNLEILIVKGYQGVKVASWMVKDNWLPGLRRLMLSSCKSLKEVPFLPPCLEKLVVENCDELMQLPLVVNTLRILELRNCPKLMLPSMSNKSLRLDDLWIERCSGIENQLFIELPFLTNLKKLKLDGFPNFQTLPNLSPTMTGLRIENCPKLTSLGNNDFSNLTVLQIKDCPKLTSLGNNDFLNLTGLVIKDFTSLGNNDFLNLTGLGIENCPKLTSLGNNDFLNLTGLRIENCPKLTSLGNNDFPNITKLTNLKIIDCPKLASLGNLLARLKYCKWLTIKKCPMLMRDEALLVEGDIIKPLSQLESIETDEPLLVLLLFQQQAVSSIRIFLLDGLQRPFPPLLEDHFHQLSSLKQLKLDGFTTLPNLEKLSSLDELFLVNCPDVELLPNLPISLQDLTAYNCPKLKVNYEEGGRLRHTISHIPHIYIGRPHPLESLLIASL